MNIFRIKNKKAFTLVEILVVVFIISLLGGLLMISLSKSKSKGGDLKIINDINQIQSALENYKNIEGSYPEQLNLGEALIGPNTGVIFMSKVPSEKFVRDGNCHYDNYEYIILNNGSYALNFCLRNNIENLSLGENCLVYSGVLDEPCYPGIYSVSEISEMIEVNNYVPVASASELNSLRNDISQLMGVGTRWENYYETGLDKKYVQVKDIDLSSYSNFNKIGETTVGLEIVYDGAGFEIRNLKINIIQSNVGLFSFLSVNGIISNVRLFGDISATSSTNIGGIVGRMEGLINNSYFEGSVNGGYNVGGIAGSCRKTIYNSSVNNSEIFGINNVGGFSGDNQTSSLIEGSFVGEGVFVDGSRYIGGFVGYNQGSIFDSSSLADVNAYTDFGGGFVGWNLEGANIDSCKSMGSLSSNSWLYKGGFVGHNRGNITNSYSSVDVRNGSHLGGFVGRIFLNSISNCYSYGLVSGGTDAGGFAGSVGGGNIYNSYYDLETSSKTDTGKGNPRTTKQMQEGYANSIVDGDSMYTGWDSGKWKFTPSNRYPELN